MALISSLFERRDHPSKSDSELYKLFSGSTRSYTGLDVTEEGALSNTAVWSAVTQLSQDIAALPLLLYQRLSPTGKKRASSRPLYHLLHVKPNPEMTTMEWREAEMCNILLEGACYNEIELDNNDDVKAIWPLLTSNMEVKRVRGQILCIYSLPDGKTAIFPPDRVLRITGFSKNGLTGYQPIKKTSEAIGLSLALEEYASRYFGSGAKPPVVLEHPTEIGEKGKKNIRESWNEMHQGLSGAHRIAILEEGMQLKEYGSSPENSQALESRKFMVEEVARIFNMPPHRLKEMTRSTFSNISHQDLEYAKYTLQPWLVRFELAYTTQLLTEKEQKKYFFEHLLTGLMRATPEERAKYYQTMIQNGLMNADEVRELENLNPQPDGQGEKYYVAMNWIPKDEPLPEPKQISTNSRGDTIVDFRQPEERKDLDYEKTLIAIEASQISYYDLIWESANRVVNKEVKAVGHQIEKHFKKEMIQKTPKITGQTGAQAYPRATRKFINWMEDFYTDDMPDYIAKQYLTVMRTYNDTISSLAVKGVGSDMDVSKQITKFTDDYVDTLAWRHSSFSKNQLKKLVEKTDAYKLKETLAGRLDSWVAKRADKIAGDEIVRASNAVAREVYRVVGVKKLQWVTRSSKPCPFCTQLDGNIVGIEKNFVEADEVLKGFDKPDKEGAPTEKSNWMTVKGVKKNPPIHRGCSCQIVPYFG